MRLKKNQIEFITDVLIEAVAAVRLGEDLPTAAYLARQLFADGDDTEQRDLALDLIPLVLAIHGLTESADRLESTCHREPRRAAQRGVNLIVTPEVEREASRLLARLRASSGMPGTEPCQGCGSYDETHPHWCPG